MLSLSHQFCSNFHIQLADLLETMQIKWPAKYGEIYRVFIGSTCNVCITSPELLEVTPSRTIINYDDNHWKCIQPILSSHSILEKGVDYKFLRFLIGDGLVVSAGKKRHRIDIVIRVWNTRIDFDAGDKWKQRRRLLTPAFHFKILENFLPFFNKNCLILCNQIENRMESSKGEMDVFPLFIRCTLDIICGNDCVWKLIAWV